MYDVCCFAYLRHSSWHIYYFIKRGIMYMKILSAVPRSDLNSSTQSQIVKYVFNALINEEWDISICLFVCLFVCLGFFVPFENFSLIWRLHHCRWRTTNSDLCTALMAIKQWGFFSVPHLLWHGISVHNGHLRRPVTLTPYSEPSAVEL